ncbi:hypothetical protein [Gracilinema caldarium]|uniref:tetratricopeptide repeat protein n=1 Tax=Gracilinema caldarium TaxID=215591 RepID=UPI0026EA47EB|nr:hypothetical protein [Gracilinema caldarium]
MDAETSIQGLLQKAYDNLKASDASSALAALEHALQIDFEDPEVVYALKCVNWWVERTKRGEEIPDFFNRGEFYLAQWKAFYGFLDRIGPAFDRCIYAIRRFVFSSALACFKQLAMDGGEKQDPELLLRIGRCYKGVGNYEQALQYLEEAAGAKKDDAEAISELADVYALVDEVRLAKALFREAFFINPQRIDLRSMESDLILLLQQKVQELGYKSPELEEWIPVYGVLFGVFNIKRELRAIELGKLKQSIFTMENELRDRPEQQNILIPRLINRYFWLIDHYTRSGEDASRIDELLLKIRVLNKSIYERYVN